MSFPRPKRALTLGAAIASSQARLPYHSTLLLEVARMSFHV